MQLGVFAFMAWPAPKFISPVIPLAPTHTSSARMVSIAEGWTWRETETVGAASPLVQPKLAFRLAVLIGTLDQAAILGLLRDALGRFRMSKEGSVQSFPDGLGLTFWVDLAKTGRHLATCFSYFSNSSSAPQTHGM